MSGDGGTGAGLLIRGARVVSPDAEPGRYLRGDRAGRLKVDPDTDVRVADGGIVEVGRGLPADPGVPVMEAEGRVLVPGFVDAHTHACWAGHRLDEWASRMAGATYTELLAAGGGILSTVQAVRGASTEELTASLLTRLDQALREGTTTLEVKSGYGLDTATELRMLSAIQAAGGAWAGTAVPTACLGHAKDPSVPDFVTRVIQETLPAVHDAFPGTPVDAYCEEGAWSVEECRRLFQAAAELGHPVRVHADQFNSLGMVEAAVEMGARSVDHLEASQAATLARLGSPVAPAEPEAQEEVPTAAVLLPVSGFHLDGRYADGRFLLDAGAAVVVATNWNPGSAPSPSIAFAAALAVRRNGLTPEEALVAVTHNAAVLLGFRDRGRIQAGTRADLVLLEARDERELAHTVGGRAARAVICGGRVVTGAWDL